MSELVASHYIVERTFNSKVSDVYEAWTDASKLSQWYGPQGMENKDISPDARISGAFGATVISPDGQEHRFDGIYREVEAEAKVVFTLDYSNTAIPAEFLARPEGFNEVVTLTFKKLGENQTHLTFRQDGYLPKHQVPLAHAGMESYFDSLGVFLEN